MSISTAARRAARLLEQTNHKVVFAESCTGGLVSGALTAIPGISNYHCGGMVVYRNATKRAYLDIPADLLDDPGPVSAPVTERLARAVLEKTPEADLAVAVTGHLGPQAPPALDGLAFVAIAWRDAGSDGRAAGNCQIREIDCRPDKARLQRQRRVVEQVLGLLGDALEKAVT